jgi:nicotinamide riboside kinase
MEENLKQQQSSTVKITLFGPESTGKTTLAKQLAAHFDTVWAPEFARDYLQEKWDTRQQICEPEDLLPIAIGQIRLENEALLIANKVLFCDTNLMVTKVFSEIYYNYCDPSLDKAAKKHKYDLFFLTDIDIPWEKDDLRDNPNERSAAFQMFKKALIENQKPFITLSGDSNERLQKAIEAINNLEKAKEMGFSSHDFVQIYDHGISLDAIQNQLNIFKKGVSKIILDRPATKEDGVFKITEKDFELYAQSFDQKKEGLQLKKFVPASGAASRMFKFLNEFLNEFDEENESINAYINRKKEKNLPMFFVGLEKFPFYQKVYDKLMAIFPDFNSWERDKKNYHFIKLMLSSEHFDFANKPKGVLDFHKYKDHIATPVEEHIKECVFYASSNSISHLHFTVSESHQQLFEEIIKDIKEKVHQKTGTVLHVGFSFQDKATDTIAVDLNNEPFRNESGNLVFRPGGHGALINNLNNLHSDIIFIKNIDNVIQNHIQEITLYKKALAGILLNLQGQIFQYLRQIEEKLVNENDIETIIRFINEKLNIEVIEDFNKYTLENKIAFVKDKLNRPIRVCGMVKNEGEPGGGPFWVSDSKGNLSLQIVESSQIDSNNAEQIAILAKSTHFNPVDLVCAIKNYKGEKFDLFQFIDQKTGFIVTKNKNGKDLKSYELPGLWNGAMAKWITVFVQVPLVTFNPVKTVNDLLKPAHQPQ